MTSPFPMPISEQIWGMKYQMKQADGTPIDVTVQDTWLRIAEALAEAEPTEVRNAMSREFYAALDGFQFLPAGRIVAGAGTDRTVTLFNCFVMGTIPDSMSGIFENLKEAGLTMQQGGGIGYDFSTLRPKGALVKGVAADASGPLSFMDCWDSMCRTVMSAGSRRGAMMATMRCDHPDIEAFIEAKRDPLKLRMFNMSVLVTDDFMAAVRDGREWRLHFENRKGETLMEKVVDARELWDKIMKSTYDYAEPGVIFIDRINQTNNLRSQETIASTNPCGEQPLPPYGACLLGSINLTTLIENPFTDRAGLDQIKLKKLVRTAVRMMDNVVDVSNFPLPQQAEEAKAKRRIGLGITGLADVLIMKGLVYGSPEAVAFTELVCKLVAIAAYEASADLAKEKGAFPLFDADTFLATGTFASTLPEDLKAKIRKDGIRNSHLTSIAPTGTISLYAGNVSSGIEPVFALSYDRKVLQPDGSKTSETVQDYAVWAYRNWCDDVAKEDQTDRSLRFDPERLPKAFVTAQTLAPMDHVRMQAAAQKWVDSSISKTVNLPEDISFEDFKAVYLAAYEMGCKGCTTYRPNDVTGSVLSVAEPAKTEPADEFMATTHFRLLAEDGSLLYEGFSKDIQVEDWPDGSGFTTTAVLDAGHGPFRSAVEPEPRPDALPGAVYKLKWPGSDHALYVTITDIQDPVSLRRRPFEVFINSKNMEHFAWTVALTRMISAIFRRPHDSRFVVEELKAVFDPKGGAWMDGKYVPSILAAIGGVIERHMRAIGYIPDPNRVDVGQQDIYQGIVEPVRTVEASELQRTVGMPAAMAAPYGGPLCPSCNSANVKKESGCFVCKDCGHSSCG
jgi:ribonucleoside-diphosphate reductase alpha chain